MRVVRNRVEIQREANHIRCTNNIRKEEGTSYEISIKNTSEVLIPRFFNILVYLYSGIYLYSGMHNVQTHMLGKIKINVAWNWTE